MEDLNIAVIWQKVLDYASQNMPGSSLWLRNAMPMGVSGGSFHILVEQPHIKAWIEEKFSAELTKFLSTTCGQPLKLSVDLAPMRTTTYKVEEIPATPPIITPLFPEKTPVVVKNEVEFISHLNPKYVFSSFVIGNSNRLAHAAAVAVAQNPGNTYNPLFLYSGVGLGKTHLMHAIGNFIKDKDPSKKILYISTETFTNDLINSIKTGTTNKFQNKYRNIDVLLIDDIQFLIGKDVTQEEFFHTFNILRDANKQIVISSDRNPNELKKLEERLVSRFNWGFVADIQPPDVETRLAILRTKAEADGIDIPMEVLNYISSTIQNNIRELEGAYTRFVGYVNFTNSPMNITTCQEALHNIVEGKNAVKVTVEDIKQAVAQYYKIKVEDLTAKSRKKNITFPRQVAMYLCRELTDVSLPGIGNYFGGRDHSTVIHACEKIAEAKVNDIAVAKDLNSITGKLLP